jgi:hypothetical protein
MGAWAEPAKGGSELTGDSLAFLAELVVCRQGEGKRVRFRGVIKVLMIGKGEHPSPSPEWDCICVLVLPTLSKVVGIIGPVGEVIARVVLASCGREAV